MESKPPIQRLTERLLVSHGLDYYNAFKTLREHLAAIDDDMFEGEMARTNNARVFARLFSVGLSRTRQEIVTARWNRFLKKEG